MHDGIRLHERIDEQARMIRRLKNIVIICGVIMVIQLGLILYLTFGR